MNCVELQPLLHAYVDAELDLARTLEIEQHLQGCPDCAEAVRQHHALRQALQEGGLYQRAPERLRQRLQATLGPRRRTRGFRTVPPWRVLGVAASLACAMLLGAAAVWLAARPSAEELQAQAVVAAHVRSLLPERPLGKASSEHHVVKPWFQGKVDFSFEVKDPEGFPLVGGSVDYFDDRKVADLVYKRREHLIDVFIWPAPGAADQGPRALTRKGYHLVHWTQAGLVYWAISDLNQAELEEFVRLIRS